MSNNQKIIDACWRAYTGFEKNDSTELIALMSPDVVFHFPTSLPYGGTFHGPQGFQAFYADIYGHYYDVFNDDAHAVLDAGSHVIVPVIARAKAKNGRTWENEHLFLFAICDGKIVEARLYPDTAKGRDSVAGVPTYPPAATAS
jgi:uncharacterized protein